MSMVVKNNLAAQMTLGELNKNINKAGSLLTKIASGEKIVSAKDDASGYAISEKMREQIRSLTQDNQNVQNGSSLFRIAEGGINDIVEELRNLKELAINAANDTNTDVDRQTIQKEFNHKMANINDIATMTNYNGKVLLDGTYRDKSILKLISYDATRFYGNLNKDIPLIDDISIYASGNDPSLVTKYSDGKIQSVNVDGVNVQAIILQLSDGTTKPHYNAIFYEVGKSIPLCCTFSVESVKGYSALYNPYTGNLERFFRAVPMLIYKDSESIDPNANDVAINLGKSNRWRYCIPPSIEEKEPKAVYSGNYNDIDPHNQNNYQGTYKCYLNPIFDDSANPIGGQVGYIYFNDDGTLNNQATQIGSVLAKDDDETEYTIFAIDFSGFTNYSSETMPGVTSSIGGWDNVELFFTTPPHNPLKIHHGTKANQATNFYINDMHTKSLGTGNLVSGTNFENEEDEDRYWALSVNKKLQTEWLETLNLAQNKTLDDISVTTKQNANVAIRVLDGAIDYALNESTRIGAYLQRLDYTDSNVVTMNENVQGAESTIRDADMAKEMTDYTKQNVLVQAAQSMLAQANQNSSAALSLLQ